MSAASVDGALFTASSLGSAVPFAVAPVSVRGSGADMTASVMLRELERFMRGTRELDFELQCRGGRNVRNECGEGRNSHISMLKRR